MTFMPMPVDSLSRAPATRVSRDLRPLANCAQCPVRETSICSVLDRCAMAEFERMGREAHFAPRAMVFMEGAPADAVYNVTSGLMRLFRILPGGQRQIVGFALPGDFIGLPPRDRYGFSADAAVRTIACRFPRDSFAAFADAHDRFLRRLHESAAEALALAHDQMTLLGPRRAEAKVAAFVLAMRRRWGGAHGTGALVPLPMGRQDIGDYLGLSIATVSRTLTGLERQRLLLIVPQGVRILNLDGLDQLAAE